MFYRRALSVLLAFLFFSALSVSAKETPMEKGLYAELTTNKGPIVLELYYDKTPLTVINFVGLAEGTMHLGGSDKPSGTPFYDGLKFHRVIKDFMIQGGCPLGTGTGGPGYTFPDEFDSTLKHTSPGILSMANAGPGTNGSQFFITHVPTPHLDGKHSVFGRVVTGMDVVNAIAQNDTIEKVTIIRVGEEAEAFKTGQAAFDAILSEMKGDEEKVQQAELEKVEKMINDQWPNAKKTQSGMYYDVLKEGSGASPKAGDTISAHYTGRLLINGRKFDSSLDRGEPLKFEVGVGRVIRGWDEALLQMKRGEKRTLIIPPELAYGDRGAGGVIPPNSWLLFNVELIDF